MSVTHHARPRSRRLLAGIAVAAIAALGLAAPAHAVKPAGSRATVMLETGDASLNPANAINSGWWGHEGGANNGTGSGSTFLSMDGSDGAGTVNDASIAALVASMGTDDIGKIRFAIVPTTADGTNEIPTVTGTQNAATVFANGWLLNDGGVGVGLNGNTSTTDSVTIVSTPTEINAWIAAGEPTQDFDNKLMLHDTNDPAHPVSKAPKGKSILNAWATGTNLSLVAYVTSGDDPTKDNKIPLVAADGTGHAKTAWLPFTTVAKPGDTNGYHVDTTSTGCSVAAPCYVSDGSVLRTSAGYQVAGPYAPSVSVSTSFTSSTTAKITGTVKTRANTTATNATGTMQFAQVVAGVDQTPTSVPVVNGVASLSVSGFTAGSSKTYDVRYVPDAAGQASYLTSAYARKTVTAPTPTTTKLSVAGGTTSDTMTATVSPKVSGKVVFTDTTSSGTTTLGSATVSTSTGTAKLVKALSARKHTIKAIFTPTSTSYAASSYAKTVWKPTISVSYSDSTPTHGTTPKMNVKVVATGTTAAGTISITWDPPSGSTKYLKYTLVNGSKLVVLPKMVIGTTKISIKYNGSSTVLAATKATLLKAH